MARPGRNDPCHCGSGKKYKKCHELRESGRAKGRMLVVLVGAALAAAVVAAAMSFTVPEESTSVRIWDPAHGHYHDANGMEIP